MGEGTHFVMAGHHYAGQWLWITEPMVTEVRGFNQITIEFTYSRTISKDLKYFSLFTSYFEWFQLLYKRSTH